MADSGGIFSRLYSFTADAAANIAAQPGRFDAELNGMATALTNRMTRDGQAPPLANLPMGSYILTGLGAGTLTGHSVNYDQLILKADSSGLSATTGATLIGVSGGGTLQATITALNGAVTGINYNDTSVTSLLIGTGAKTLTVSTGKSFTIGQFVTIANTPTPANYMFGQITAYNSGTGVLTVNVTSIGGAGTFTAWTIALSSPSAPFTGGTLTSELITLASATGTAGFNVPHGAAPTAPVNGDVWTTTTAVFARINGTTKTLADTTQILGFTGGTLTSELITVASAVGTAGLNIPHGAAPTSPVNGDTWTTLTGLFARINGVTAQFATNASIASSYAPLTSPALIGAPTTLGFEIGFRDLPTNTQGGVYTLALTDRGQAVLASGNITVPANASIAFPVTSAVTIINNTAATITIAITTDTMTLAGGALAGTRTLAANGIATLYKKAATSWLIGGNVT